MGCDVSIMFFFLVSNTALHLVCQPCYSNVWSNKVSVGCKAGLGVGRMVVVRGADG